ncbi:B4 protein, partial [Rhinopomastus cyanomelas]|nr:B4 protein [Rhinopomastus cyanomelas]
AAPLPTPPARGQRARHPPTLHMVIEVLQAHSQAEGVSVIAIRRFILAKYPSVDPVRLRPLLKRALSRGLSRGVLVRPRNSSAVGATGRFKVSGGLTTVGLRGSGLPGSGLPAPLHAPLAPAGAREAPAGEGPASGGGRQ